MSITSTAATIFFKEVEKTVGKKKFAVEKKKVAVEKKVFTPLLHKGVKSFLCAQRNDFSFIGSAYKKLNNAERCCRKAIFRPMSCCRQKQENPKPIKSNFNLVSNLAVEIRVELC